MMNSIESLLTLLSVPGVGQTRLHVLISAFGSAEAVLAAGTEELCRAARIEKKTAQAIVHSRDEAFVEEQLALAEKKRISFVSFWDQDYPPMLKSIYDPPALLFIKGDIQTVHEDCLAIVGMRACSRTGREIAERFAGELSMEGITIVSGLARGVDTAAHSGALRSNGKTAAVLGCGPDFIYPPENRFIYSATAENGVIISELPIGTEPIPGFFPRRNRIISGLSLGTIVVEAGPKSGSLITALLALDQGREVFAVPGSIQSMKSRGTHQLIRQGAKLVECKDDILCELPQLARRQPQAARNVRIERALTAAEKEVWAHLGHEAVHIDELAEKAGRSVSEILSVLLGMELKGYVTQSMGKMFTRN